jgi:hypothetical protein
LLGVAASHFTRAFENLTHFTRAFENLINFLLLQAIATNDIQDVRPIIRHVTAHPHGVAAAYDELLKNAPTGSSRAKLPLRGGRGGGGGVFSQFVVNEAPPQVICTGTVTLRHWHIPSSARVQFFPRDFHPGQVATKEDEVPPPQKPKPKRLITRIDKF